MLLGVVCLNFSSTFILLWTLFGLYEYLKFTGTCNIISYTVVCYIQRRWWHPTPVLLPGKSHGQRSLVGCSPWGRDKSYTTEWLHFHFSLSCTGEGNGNSFLCSYLENPRDGGAWWASIYGVTQSRTWLKWLSRSSSSSQNPMKEPFFTPGDCRVSSTIDFTGRKFHRSFEAALPSYKNSQISKNKSKM